MWLSTVLLMSLSYFIDKSVAFSLLLEMISISLPLVTLNIDTPWDAYSVAPALLNCEDKRLPAIIAESELFS